MLKPTRTRFNNGLFVQAKNILFAKAQRFQELQLTW